MRTRFATTSKSLLSSREHKIKADAALHYRVIKTKKHVRRFQKHCAIRRYRVESIMELIVTYCSDCIAPYMSVEPFELGNNIALA